jgi:hypothetical protein
MAWKRSRVRIPYAPPLTKGILMNKLHLTNETPREIGSLIYDMGKGAVTMFIRHMNEPISMSGTSYEEPIDTTVWGSMDLNDEEITSLVAAIHEVQRQ